MTLTPQGLVETVALHLAMSENRVKNYDRKLMEAGLRTKKGHGRGSAIMTMNDAAMLLIAIASTEEVNDSAATAAHLWDFPLLESADLSALIELTGVDARYFKKLGPAVVKIMNYLASTASEDTFVSLKVTLVRGVPAWAQIILTKKDQTTEINFRKKAMVSVLIGGFQVDRLILGSALLLVAKRVVRAASTDAARGEIAA